MPGKERELSLRLRTEGAKKKCQNVTFVRCRDLIYNEARKNNRQPKTSMLGGAETSEGGSEREEGGWVRERWQRGRVRE